MSVIKELNDSEAIDILESLEDYIDSGSSRAVYECMYNDKHCVVKVACDQEGRCQNRIECDLYEETESCYLAVIYAKYKDYFHIMEYVEPINYELRDMVENGEELEEEDDERIYTDYKGVEQRYTISGSMGYESFNDMMRDYHGVQDVSYFLYDWQGETSDNYQCGTNECGDIVAYDYGYDTKVKHRDQVGDIESFRDPVEYIVDTIKGDLDIDRYKDYDDDDEGEDYDE